MASNGSGINWEAALGDVKDLVCKHLDQEDLCTLTKVNLSWRKAAMWELSKRYSPEVEISLINKPIKAEVKEIKVVAVYSGPMAFEQAVRDLEKQMRKI